MSHPLRIIGGMDTERAEEAQELGLSERVARVMGRLAAGEQQAIWELHDLAEPWLRRMVRAEARRIDFRLGDDDVIDLTLDAAIELGHLAGSWRPDGAPPWVWARRRINALVHAHIGQLCRPLDDEHLEVEAPPIPPPAPQPLEVLRALARRHPGARALQEQLTSAVSERDADIWLGVQIEKGGGNRSPAVTVAAESGLRPESVRKVVQRVGERLGQVA